MSQLMSFLLCESCPTAATCEVVGCMQGKSQMRAIAGQQQQGLPEVSQALVTKPEMANIQQLPISHPWKSIVVFPDSDLHRKLALKLAKAKPGEMLPLTNDELALLSEFFTWPNQPRTA